MKRFGKIVLIQTPLKLKSHSLIKNGVFILIYDYKIYVILPRKRVFNLL